MSKLHSLSNEQIRLLKEIGEKFWNSQSKKTEWLVSFCRKNNIDCSILPKGLKLNNTYIFGCVVWLNSEGTVNQIKVYKIKFKPTSTCSQKSFLFDYSN